MKLHPREAITKKAKSVLIDFIQKSIFINELTWLEKIIVLRNVLDSYTDEYLKIELRLERHNDPDKPAGIE